MKYYLINNTIKKGSEMPIQHLANIYADWYLSLQPCEISETLMSDLANYLRDFEMGIYSPIPTNISDLVYDNNGIITFKHPKNIQIGDTIEYTIDNKNTPYLHGKTFRVEVASIDENNCYVYAPYGQDIVPIEQAKLVDSKSQKQVDGEIEAVEFAEFLKADFEMVDGANGDIYWQLCGTKQNYKTKQLYEIFKNRK